MTDQAERLVESSANRRSAVTASSRSGASSKAAGAQVQVVGDALLGGRERARGDDDLASGRHGRWRRGSALLIRPAVLSRCRRPVRARARPAQQLALAQVVAGRLPVTSSSPNAPARRRETGTPAPAATRRPPGRPARHRCPGQRCAQLQRPDHRVARVLNSTTCGHQGHQVDGTDRLGLGEYIEKLPGNDLGAIVSSRGLARATASWSSPHPVNISIDHTSSGPAEQNRAGHVRMPVHHPAVPPSACQALN